MFAKFFHEILYRVSHQRNKKKSNQCDSGFGAAESVRAQKTKIYTLRGAWGFWECEGCALEVLLLVSMAFF